MIRIGNNSRVESEKMSKGTNQLLISRGHKSVMMAKLETLPLKTKISWMLSSIILSICSMKGTKLFSFSQS